MAGISTGIGLVSGLNIEEIVGALIAAQRAPAVRMEQRVQSLQASSLGFNALQTTMLTLKTSAGALGNRLNFDKPVATVADGAPLKVTANVGALPGSYRFQAVRRATSHQSLSKGFAQGATLAAGTIAVATGGHLESSRTLDLFNGGAGVSRGSIRVTDRTGASAVLDLSGAQTVDDVLDAINGSNLAVTAKVAGDRFVLSDTSGSTASNLSVSELNGGRTAADLGLLQSVGAATLTGSAVYYAAGDFSLSEINDGNALDLATGLADLRVTHAGGAFDVDLDGAKTVGDVLTAINAATGNSGAVTAALASGRITLTDSAGGPLTVENINGASAAGELGIGGTAAGGTLTGRSLTGGLNSVLLRNLFGGDGVTQLGPITLTDRAGNSATVDLSTADTLDDVLQAINGAATVGDVKLNITARVDEGGGRIRIEDTSGATASNLVIADGAGSTLAAQFGIATDDAVTGVTSGRLNLRYVSGGTRLDTYAPGGKAVAAGSFRVTDASGNTSTVRVDSTVETLDDLFAVIRTAAPNVGVELNSTGDGFRLYSLSGTGDIAVQEAGGRTAADLGILGTGAADGDGASQIVSRQTVTIDVAAGDTLSAVVSKFRNSAAPATASVFNDCTALAPERLSLTSKIAGRAGRLVVDDGGLGLGLTTRREGRDALLRVGDGSGAFLLASSSNTFRNAVDGLDVEVLGADAQPAEVVVSRDDSKVESMLEDFVGAYNAIVGAIAELTKFDPETGERGALQGDGLVLRAAEKLDAVVNDPGSGGGGVRSLVELGVGVEQGGKLSLDTERLAGALAEDPDAVSAFFLDATTGFADRLEAALDSLTDRFTGTLTLKQQSLEDTIDSLNERIDTLDAVLAGRRDRLLLKFIKMEQALSTLTTQQQALGNIRPLSLPSSSDS